MMANPVMVEREPGASNTRLMEVCAKRILVKGGAEGYQAMGVMPGALGRRAPEIGIVFKVSDVRPFRRGMRMGFSATAFARRWRWKILKQLGYIPIWNWKGLAEFGPIKPITNARKIVVGEARSGILPQTRVI